MTSDDPCQLQGTQHVCSGRPHASTHHGALTLTGTKHVLLWPPDARPLLYYAKRQNTFAEYSPSTGEKRHRRVIETDNTAGVNIAKVAVALMASDDLFWPLIASDRL